VNSESHAHTQLRVPFGEKDGRLYRPDTVERGLACGCICPECSAKLLVRRSSTGRFHFAHHRSKDCPGGYETALHKMAKQILLDAGRVWLPDREVTFSFPLVFGQTLSETLHFASREVLFVSAVSEKKHDNGFIPDVTALLKNQAPLYIEILVTHSVDDRKSQALDNLMEIDLGGLSEEIVLNPSALETEVLKSAPRWWHQCSLIDELPKFQIVRDELAAKVPGEIKRLELQRQREEIAKRREERAAKQKRERQEALIKNKESARKPWLTMLKRMEHIETKGRLEVASRVADRAKPHLETIAKRLGFDATKWPSFMNIAIDKDWVFNEDRRLWQAAVFDLLIFPNEPGHIISAHQALAGAEKASGVREWAIKLSQLKQTHWNKPYNQNKDDKFRGVWFLTSAENRAIRSPYAVVLSYLKKLCNRGVLAEEPSGKTFRILVSATDIRAMHEYEKKNTGSDRARKGVAALNASLGNVFSEMRNSHVAEQEWKTRRAAENQRVEYSVNDASAIAAAGNTTAIFCRRCKRHHFPESPIDCPMCHSNRLRVVKLTKPYLDSLPSRLKCMP